MKVLLDLGGVINNPSNAGNNEAACATHCVLIMITGGVEEAKEDMIFCDFLFD
jgi:hypothetical protein